MISSKVTVRVNYNNLTTLSKRILSFDSLCQVLPFIPVGRLFLFLTHTPWVLLTHVSAQCKYHPIKYMPEHTHICWWACVYMHQRPSLGMKGRRKVEVWEVKEGYTYHGGDKMEGGNHSHSPQYHSLHYAENDPLRDHTRGSNRFHTR